MATVHVVSRCWSDRADVDLLAPLESRRSLYLAQELLETDGWDLKLYGVGSQVWAVRKRSPVSFDGPGPRDGIDRGGRGAGAYQLGAARHRADVRSGVRIGGSGAWTWP